MKFQKEKRREKYAQESGTIIIEFTITYAATKQI